MRNCAADVFFCDVTPRSSSSFFCCFNENNYFSVLFQANTFLEQLNLYHGLCL